MPAFGDEAKQGAGEAGDEAALGEQLVEILVGIGAAVLHVKECAVDAHEDENVDDSDGEQKESGDERADDAADSADAGKLILEGGCRRRDSDGCQHDDA